MGTVTRVAAIGAGEDIRREDLQGAKADPQQHDLRQVGRQGAGPEDDMRLQKMGAPALVSCRKLVLALAGGQALSPHDPAVLGTPLTRQAAASRVKREEDSIHFRGLLLNELIKPPTAPSARPAKY